MTSATAYGFIEGIALMENRCIEAGAPITNRAGQAENTGAGFTAICANRVAGALETCWALLGTWNISNVAIKSRGTREVGRCAYARALCVRKNLVRPANVTRRFAVILWLQWQLKLFEGVHTGQRASTWRASQITLGEAAA